MFGRNRLVRSRRLPKIAPELFSFFLIIFAFSFRFIDLSVLPNGLYWDEQDTGYQAYSLLRTGHDYFGNYFPLFPHSLAEWRAPVHIYSTVLPVSILGLTPISVRLPAVIFGSISLLLFYWLMRLFVDRLPAAVTVLALSVSPWHFLFTRYHTETSFMFMFLCLGLLAFFKFVRTGKYLPFSMLSFSLSLASYSPAKLFVPLLLIILFWIYRRIILTRLTPRISAISSLIFLFIALPITLVSSFGPAGSRWHDVALSSDPQLSADVNRDRLSRQISRSVTPQIGLTPSFQDRLFINKPAVLVERFIKNYLSNYSTSFLFTSGDSELRHSVGVNRIGQLLSVDLVLLAFGIIYLVQKYPSLRNSAKLIILMLVLSPLPSALTREGGAHAIRSFFMILPLFWIVAYGFQNIFSFPKFISLVILTIYFISIANFLQYFFSFYRLESASSFNWGFDRVISQALSDKTKFDKVFIDFYRDSPLMAYLFATHFDPSLISTQNAITSQSIGQGQSAYIFGNIYLLTPGQRNWKSLNFPGNNRVYSIYTQPEVSKLSSLPPITYPDFTPAYYIFNTTTP